MKFEPTMHKLSNGVTVILDSMDVATDEVRVCFRTGSYDEKPSEYGLTHFCEHMFCKGTPRFPTARLGKDYIADNGGEVNASTSPVSLRFYGRVIAENLMILVDFLADRLKNSLIDKDVLENERGPILDELRRSLSDNETKRFVFTNKKLLGVDIPNGMVTLGNPENISRFTREDILNFASKRMVAENCLICISGKIENKDDLLKKLEDIFSFLPKCDAENKSDLKYTPSSEHNYIPDTTNVVIEFLFPCLWPDTPEYDYQDCCVAKFERCLREKLFDVLRSENGLTYGVRLTGYGDMKTQLCGFRTETSPENVARVVALTAKTAYDVYTTGYPKEKDLRKYMNQNKLGRANFLDANDLRCNRLVTDWLKYNRLHDFYGQCKLSDSVTVDDVKKYTRGYFDGPMSIITHGPKIDCDVEKIWKNNFK